jgi:hypothetical protein
VLVVGRFYGEGVKNKMLAKVAAFREEGGVTDGPFKAGTGVAFFPEGSISTVLECFASILSKYAGLKGKAGEGAVTLLITGPEGAKGLISKEKDDEKQQGIPVPAGGVSVPSFSLSDDVSTGCIPLGPAFSVSAARTCSPLGEESDLFATHDLPVFTGTGAFLPLFAGEPEEENGLVASVSGGQVEGGTACTPSGVEGFGFSAGTAGTAPAVPVAVERSMPAASLFPGEAKKDDVSASFSPSFSGDSPAIQEISIVDSQAAVLTAGKASDWAGNTPVRPDDVLTGFGAISRPAAEQFSAAEEFSGEMIGGKGGTYGRGANLLPASPSGFSGLGPENSPFPATGGEAVSGRAVEAPWKKPGEEGLEDVFRNMPAFSKGVKASLPPGRSDSMWQFWPAQGADGPGGLPAEGRDVILAAGGLPEQSRTRSFDEAMAITGTGFSDGFGGKSIPVNLFHLAAAISQMVLQTQQRQAVLRIKLIPEHLGELTVHLAMAGKKLTVTFSAAEQATREVLAGNLAQLQHHLLHLDHRLEDVILQVDKGIASGLPSSLAEGRNPKEENGGGWEHPDRSGTLLGEGSGRSGIVMLRQDRFSLGVPAWLNILV